jgi:DNA-binding transcriptional MerR regulator
LVGITYRQLDYWARTDLLKPSLKPAKGSGSQRLYSFGDVVQLKVVKRLLDAGMSLKKIRQAIEILREQLPTHPKRSSTCSDAARVCSASPSALFRRSSKARSTPCGRRKSRL